LLANHPDRAVESVRTIQRLSREALAQMRQALGIVRGQASDGIPPPQPTLAELPALIERNRDAGLSTTLHVDGVPRSLPPGLELSGYRVVQESLTNVRKHAGDASVQVILRYRPASFEIEISDDGAGVDVAGHPSGQGLIGMRERVSFFGGVLDTGRPPGGGFVVKATFPVSPAVEA
jgi:signal transduction histidine kinase